MTKEIESLQIIKATLFHHTKGCLTAEEEAALKVIEDALRRPIIHDTHYVHINHEMFSDMQEKCKAIDILKEECKVYTESLMPLGPATWGHVYLNMTMHLSDQEEKEKFCFLRSVLL